MADPIIISTPKLEDSTYTSAIQPAIFTISNTKFPVNTESEVITLSSGHVTENFGFVSLNLVNGTDTFEVNDYLTVSNEPLLNGVYRIQAKAGDVYTIDLAYNSAYSTLTPDVQRYYNNYFNEILVYAVSEGESLESQIGTDSLKALPVYNGSSNIASFNVSGLLKSELNTGYNISRFYIEYRETYDVSTNGVVDSSDNTWLTEEADLCSIGEEYHDNPNMESDTTWLYGNNTVYDPVNDWFSTTTSGGDFINRSITLVQSGGLFLPKEGLYNIKFSGNNLSGDTLRYRLYWINQYLNQNNELKFQIINVATGTYSSTMYSYDEDVFLYPYTNPDDSDSLFVLEIEDITCANGTCGNGFTVNTFSVQALDCQLKYYGVYGVNQFQDNDGFNFRSKVFGLPSTYTSGEFLSTIHTYRYFPDNDLKISYILNPALSQTGQNIFEELNWYSASGALLDSNTRLLAASTNAYREMDINYFVDTFGVPLSANYAEATVYYIPDNLMTENASGTFDNCANFDFVDVNVSGLTTCNSGPFGNTLDNYFMLVRPNDGAYDNTIQLACYSNEDITTQVGEVYELECQVHKGGGFQQGHASICLIPYKDSGGGVNLYTESDYTVETFYTYTGDSVVVKIKTTFTALDTDVKVGVGFFLPDGGLAPLAALFQLKNITVKGPRIDLSTPVRVKYDETCRKNEIQLKWYNSLGGWEYWTFTGDKEYSFKVGAGKEIKKDVYLDFINGTTEYEYTQTDIRPRIKVRSQLVNYTESAKLNLIKESVEVYDITGVKPIQVQVDRNSITFRKDNDKLYVVEFDLLYPNRQTVIK